MQNYKTYGKPPYQTLLIHGGPGAAGEMASLAREISDQVGVVEPFQTKKTIEELVLELHEVIQETCPSSVYLVGYSWGAWLSYLYSAIYPEQVKKLVLIGSGPFEERYASEISAVRMNRMNDGEKIKFAELTKKLSRPDANTDKVLKQFGQLMSALDSYAPISVEAEEGSVDFELYHSVWGEASKLRASGLLLEYGNQITCPVVAIHGKYDPHPYQGVIEPLSTIIKDFRYILLEKCGHTPWMERFAKQRFREELLNQLEIS
ncbi:alpha/beta fold hydrolase [Paenibacillus sp. J2TS4]|uniref:alpha/beta fold hydrolase n=1 Tax=Paenibacillus sp. J2TS4 TaxID=2807194 RepID=UPI001B0F40A4|nr:alpha/beta hydrolase [Paenibacillus sp. J2TS4]GIP31685.1 alpha/beta hydrolase [Paenibacillus sp. J2TS4]